MEASERGSGQRLATVGDRSAWQNAQAEHSYGQLLKAKLRQAAVQTQIAPDSADVELSRVKEDLAKAEQSGNRVLAAVYQSVLGRIYKDKADGNGYRFGADDPNKTEYKALSAEYYAKSMEPVEQLAKQSSKGYEPALVEGADSHIFGGDLLHVLGMEAEDYQTLHDWYLNHGNRQAACICAYYQTQKDRFADVNEVRKSKYLQTIDSLINVYQDLKECGELAIERYQFMDQAEDATAEEKMGGLFALAAAFGRGNPTDGGEENRAIDVSGTDSGTADGATEEEARRIHDVVAAVGIGLSDPSESVRQAAYETVRVLNNEEQGVLTAQILSGDDAALKRQLVADTSGSANERDIMMSIGALDNSDAETARAAADNLKNVLGQKFSTQDEALAWWEKNHETFLSQHEACRRSDTCPKSRHASLPLSPSSNIKEK